MSRSSDTLATEGAAVVLGAVAGGADPLSPELRRHAVRALIDWSGCVVAGGRAPVVAKLRSALLPVATAAFDAGSGPGRGLAVLHPDGGVGPALPVALLNGTAAHALEADDIFREGIVHPGAPVISTVLSVTEAAGAPFEHALRGIVAGYEVAARVATALGAAHYRLWHVTGTAGALGAAAGAAAALGLDRSAGAHAIATAATLAAGLQTALAGDSESKPLHAGHAAHAGALSGLAAQRGLRGAPAAVDGSGGLLEAMAGSSSRSVLFDGFPEGPAVTRVTFKNHLCCGHAFAAIDAALALRRRHRLSSEDVAEVTVGTYGAALRVAGNRTASNPAEARFSLPYLVAHALVHGGVRLDAFEPARLADPALRALADRVQLRVDPELDRAFPQRRAARVTLRLRNGELLEWEQPHRRGDPEEPLTDAELEEKHGELAGPVIGSERAERMISRLWALAEVRSDEPTWLGVGPHAASGRVGDPEASVGANDATRGAG